MKQHHSSNIQFYEALIPIIFLIVLLSFNVLKIFGDDATSGPNQFALLLSGAVAAVIGFKYGLNYDYMLEKVAKNIQSTSGAILILLFVGALTGTWLLSGVIPTMVYYGLQLLNPKIFLASTLIITALVSLIIGSSWSTTATVGIALIGIGKALGFPPEMVAGAVISGAYFGDKMSPLSDTTNLASAVAGVDLYRHVRYMMYTTFPSIIITLLFFIILGFTRSGNEIQDTSTLLNDIKNAFFIHPVLLLVPAIVIFLIIKKTPPLVALLAGVLLGGFAALIFQKDLLHQLIENNENYYTGAYKNIIKAIVWDINIKTDNPILNELFSSGGMKGMLSTIWLIISAMFFGGIMEAIGALKKISETLLNAFKGTFGLFASTDLTCIAFNATASDQYLAIVVPGKMYKQAYDDAGLAPENLSRTLEDSGTVTSVLVPWNTGGAYNSKVLGVATENYLIYAMFNWLSPVMTLIFAYFRIKIKKLNTNNL
jgi:NhaC family Na+:H+ antiporter